MLFIVREQLLDPNGTVYARNYAHREEFTEMKDVQSLDIPFMNGTQFIAWYVTPFGMRCVSLIWAVLGARIWSAGDVKYVVGIAQPVLMGLMSCRTCSLSSLPLITQTGTTPLRPLAAEMIRLDPGFLLLKGLSTSSSRDRVVQSLK